MYVIVTSATSYATWTAQRATRLNAPFAHIFGNFIPVHETASATSTNNDRKNSMRTSSLRKNRRKGLHMPTNMTKTAGTALFWLWIVAAGIVIADGRELQGDDRLRPFGAGDNVYSPQYTFKNRRKGMVVPLRHEDKGKGKGKGSDKGASKSAGKGKKGGKHDEDDDDEDEGTDSAMAHPTKSPSEPKAVKSSPSTKNGKKTHAPTDSDHKTKQPSTSPKGPPSKKGSSPTSPPHGPPVHVPPSGGFYTPPPTHSPYDYTSKGKGYSKSHGKLSSESKKTKKTKKSKKQKSEKKSKKLKTKKSPKMDDDEVVTTYAPTVMPVAAPSDDSPTGTRPPSPVAQPTPSDQPTTDPSAGSPSIVTLTAYALDYTVTEDRIPFRSEYLEVVELTRMYLAGFMTDQFADTNMAFLNEFLTIFTGSSFNFGEPINVEYGSTAVFDASSPMIPSVAALDNLVSLAFTGENLNGYIGMLQALPPSNVFSTTVFVNKTEVGEDSVPSTLSGREQRVQTAASIVAAVAGLALLAAGSVYYKRLKLRSDGLAAISFEKNNNSDVDGDTATYTGETASGMWSSASETEHLRRRFEPEEDTIFEETEDEIGSDDEDDSLHSVSESHR